MNSNSGRKLDIKLLPYIQNITNGFFIECGANNGIYESNTLLYEKGFGWRGLLIEANPFMFQQCKKNRPNCIVENYALVSSSYQNDTINGFFQFTDYENSMMGQVCDRNKRADINGRWKNRNPISVPAITLDNLLIKNKIERVDFFSLDVECYELEVLNGLNLKKNFVLYILIEVGYEDDYPQIEKFFFDNNYQFVEKLSSNDFLYKRNF